METKRTLELDSQEIKQLIKELNDLKKTIKTEVDKEMERVLTEAVAYCVSITPVSDKEGNHLVDSTYWEKTERGYRIVQEGDHVAYVEFGTGEVGIDSSHPVAKEVGWRYGMGSTIITTKDGRTGWFYPTDELYTSMRTGKTSKKYKFTQGQIAHAQMWKTAEFVSRKLGDKVKYVVFREVEKLGNNN